MLLLMSLQVVGLTRSMGQRLTQLKEPITVNCICPGLVPTNIMPEAISSTTPAEFVTPLTTIVRAVEQFVLDVEGKYQGQVAECSGQSIEMRPVNAYKDDATRYIYSDDAYAKADREKLYKEMIGKKEELARSIASVS
jgi:15-hydroxyprostaglandin dehydrogenase (NAD)